MGNGQWAKSSCLLPIAYFLVTCFNAIIILPYYCAFFSTRIVRCLVRAHRTRAGLQNETADENDEEDSSFHS